LLLQENKNAFTRRDRKFYNLREEGKANFLSVDAF